ncbi:MAG: sigma-54 dependent transcriptional regulator, partial [Chitinophagaceae bacterium]
MQKILVIDDDRDMCLLLKRFLDNHGFTVSLAFNSKQALETLELTEPLMVFCDFRLDNNDGKTMLLKIKEVNPRLPVLIITGYSDIHIAVGVMKLGAYNYLTKPIIPDEILLSIHEALNATGKKTRLRSTIPGMEKAEQNEGALPGNDAYCFDKSEVLRNIDNLITEVAHTCNSLLIYGESGTGKETIAREIHKRSRRSTKPFVVINCSAMSKEMAASELFGQEKVSLAGSFQQKTGNLELAQGGTIFLDEISSLPHDVTLSLFRVMEGGKIRRVSGVKDIYLDVHIIIANSEDLPGTAQVGKPGEELFHKFNKCSLTLPPLRERKEDIMVFAHHFLQHQNLELGKNLLGFSEEAEEVLLNYNWYGNLRELKNVVRRAVLLTDGEYVRDRSLPFEICNFNKLLFKNINNEQSLTHPKPTSLMVSSIPRTLLHENSLKEVSIDAEYEMILETLKQSNFNKSRAA